MPKFIIALCPWNLLSSDSWIKKNFLSTNNKKGVNFKTSWDDKSIICRLGCDTHNGKRVWSNLPEPGPFMRGRFKFNTQTAAYGSSIQKWRWKISLLIIRETYGKGPFTICPEKTSFGLNMRTCNKFWVNLKRPGTSSGDGWTGCPEKRLGWGTLSLSNEWGNHKRREMFFINTLRQVQIWPLTSK
jgi:hypothetical protein